MAVLSAGDRAELDRYAQRYLTRDVGGAMATLSAADLRAAINAIDDWAEANATSFNTAIPQPARTVLTNRMKAQLLKYVISKRSERAT